jgi:hypothetical protein
VEVPNYCRDIETYLCRKNDGHLMRIVGPSFEIVTQWAALGIPLKVACSGIDRCFERYYRKGPRRRPIKIDFCNADVLDVFDEWRKAIGLTAAPAEGDVGAAEAGAGPEAARRRHGPSLPEHLERVLTKLSSLRATGVLTDTADALIDRVSAELDVARTSTRGLRGDARREVLARLAVLDLELIAVVKQSAAPSVLEQVARESGDELGPYRASMAPDVYAAATERAAVHALRERLGLPTIAFT